MVCSKTFFVIYTMNFLSIMTGLFTVTNYKTYAQANEINDDSYFANLGAVASICGSLRFIWSAGLDCAPYKLVYGILLGIQIVLNLTMPLVSHRKGAYGLYVSLIMFCEGGHFSLVPNVLRKVYADRATVVFGLMFSFSGLCSLLMIVLQNQFITSHKHSYDAFFFINGGLSVVSAILLKCCFSQTRFVA